MVHLKINHSVSGMYVCMYTHMRTQAHKPQSSGALFAFGSISRGQHFPQGVLAALSLRVNRLGADTGS